MPDFLLTTHPPTLARHQKERYLASLPPHDLSQNVLMPLLRRTGLTPVVALGGAGLKDLQEYPGTQLMLAPCALGPSELYAVLPVAGKLNLSQTGSIQLKELLNRCDRVLHATVAIDAPHEKRRPDVLVIATTGIANDSARRQLAAEFPSSRLLVWDSIELISLLDEHYAEFWWGIDETVFPYLRGLQSILLAAPDYICISEGNEAPITDSSFIPLYLHRVEARLPRCGNAELEPEVLELTATSVIHRSEPRVLILGGPGSGKTTVLRRMAFALAADAMSSKNLSQIPVLLRCQEVAANPDDTLTSQIQRKVCEVSTLGRPCFTDDDLRMGRVAVLLDAIDELAPADREGLATKLSQFIDAYPKCRIVLTSRDYTTIRTHPLFGSLYHYNVSDLSLADAARIVDKAALGQEAPKPVVKEVLRRLQDVHGFRLSPLLVTIYVAGNDFTNVDVPPNITEVFKKYSEMLLGRWDQRKGLAQQHVAVKKDFLLQRVAFAMHRDRLTRLSVERAKEIMYEELIQIGSANMADSLFDEVVLRSGLLRIEDGEVQFNHHLMQEFFAGRAVSDLSFFEKVVHDDWWRAPILFAFGERPRECSALRALTCAADLQLARDRFEAAVTIGLAAQACHLSALSERSSIMSWGVNALAETMLAVGDLSGPHGRFPLLEFLTLYLLGRDAIAGDSMDFVANQLLESALYQPDEREDLVSFWVLSGLIESGKLERAALELERFDPKDRRLLLAIHLGCYLIARLRMAERSDKEAAERMAASLAGKVVDLRQQVFREFRSHLLEMRQSKIAAIQE